MQCKSVKKRKKWPKLIYTKQKIAELTQILGITNLSNEVQHFGDHVTQFIDYKPNNKNKQTRKYNFAQK